MPNPLTLLDAFARVPAPRRPHGRFHPLVAVLARTTVAMLAGCNSLSALAPFGRDRGRPLAVALGFRRAKTPNPSALGKLFRRLDIAAFENALAVWRASRRWTGEHAALDGKTLTGSLPGGLPGNPCGADSSRRRPPSGAPFRSLRRPTNTRRRCGGGASCPGPDG
jgi:hypothetical protein